jgi:5-methylcytosine-specific restriction endonuclease McrA
MNNINHIDLHRLSEEYHEELQRLESSNSKTLMMRCSTIMNSNEFQYLADNEQYFIQQFLEPDVVKQYITSNIPNLSSIIETNQPLVFYNANLNQETVLGSLTSKIFNYSWFRESKKAIWLGNKLGIKSCLYCNSQYTLTTGKNIHYTFDHFYSKKRFPYLALSFYNLIPCCDPCNRMKSDRDCIAQNCWHPYGPSTLDITFKLDMASAAKFALRGFSHEATLKIHCKSGDQTSTDHVTDFDLADRMGAHFDIAAEIIWKSKIYTSKYKRELQLLLRDLGITKNALERFIVSNYTRPTDMHKRPLSKLTYDLAKDVKLI